MKVGQATICYQHQQAQDILEKLLRQNFISITLCSKAREDIKEAIDWITEANESANRMENKLLYYKEINHEKIAN